MLIHLTRGVTMPQDMAAENLLGHAGFGGVAPNGKSNGGGSK